MIYNWYHDKKETTNVKMCNLAYIISLYTIRSSVQSYVYHSLYMYSQVVAISHNTL